MEENRLVKLFLDDSTEPFAELKPPVKFTLDTTKITDGQHKLKVIAKSTDNREGIKIIPFIVRNGPSISVVGLDANETVEDQIPITINAYGSERNDMFIVTGSETPKAIPAWVWALLVVFITFGLYYLLMYWDIDFYQKN